MDVWGTLRSTVKRARKRGALWVLALDQVRLFVSAEGRALLWTKIVHRAEVHQTTPQTSYDRYPALFDLAAELAPDAKRILSFGCSTGEELVALRRRFSAAQIVGAEINPRSRGIARRRVADDAGIEVVRPEQIIGEFDLVFALAVLQREPHKIAETDTRDLSRHYPFSRFDAAVRRLVGMLRKGGLLCVTNSQYRVEDSGAAAMLRAARRSPRAKGPFFGPDGYRLEKATARTVFRKL